jgi:hypothetical protein
MRIYRCDVCQQEVESENQLGRLDSYTSADKELVTAEIKDACSSCRDKLKEAFQKAVNLSEEYKIAKYQSLTKALVKEVRT